MQKGIFKSAHSKIVRWKSLRTENYWTKLSERSSADSQCGSPFWFQRCITSSNRRGGEVVVFVIRSGGGGGDGSCCCCWLLWLIIARMLAAAVSSKQWFVETIQADSSEKLFHHLQIERSVQSHVPIQKILNILKLTHISCALQQHPSNLILKACNCLFRTCPLMAVIWWGSTSVSSGGGSSSGSVVAAAVVPLHHHHHLRPTMMVIRGLWIWLLQSRNPHSFPVPIFSQ